MTNRRSNVKEIEVRLSAVYRNPTWDFLFGTVRTPLTVGQWIPMTVNHYHYSKLVNMAGTFQYEVRPRVS